MLCVNPFRPRRGIEFGCGQCLPCRLNRRRMWTGRIMLESLAHKFSSFLTLTYTDEVLKGSLSLSNEHWREFTKGIGFRYFGCGEYGERTARPHYHVVLYGLDPATAEAFALQRWPHGFVHVGLGFSRSVAAYVASYTVKKMTKADDPRLDGRLPEFARMSRRPALGWPGVQSLVRWLATPVGQDYIRENLDVPNAVRVDNQVLPLGRTLVCKLRELLDVPASDPARSARSEGRLLVLDAEQVRERELVRYANYDVLKARAGRRAGVF